MENLNNIYITTCLRSVIIVPYKATSMICICKLCKYAYTKCIKFKHAYNWSQVINVCISEFTDLISIKRMFKFLLKLRQIIAIRIIINLKYGI